MKTFQQMLGEHNIELHRQTVKVLQVNIGRRCNQACHHCHVEAGPDRTENMTRVTVDRLLELLALSPEVHTVDITGGAPELNPHFQYFVKMLGEMEKTVIDRCNLTVFFEQGQEQTAEFLAENQVQVIASLPCYTKDKVEKQRGHGVFDKSICGLQKLNQLGYGKPNTELTLNLVYNPVGDQLPPSQTDLQAEYKAHLSDEYGIVFNQLFTVTNMPIKRFAHMLARDGREHDYMQLLIDNFNSDAATQVMCQELVSIGWDGSIYDCDFNQMLDIPLRTPVSNIWEMDKLPDAGANIAVSNHCFACTAGAGSSCGGALL